MLNRMNFILPLLIFVLVTVIVVPPAYAKVLTFDIDKHTFYVAGDTITFSGTSDTAYDIISIVIYEPPDDKGNKKLVTAKGTIAGSDKKFEESIQITSGVFKKHGIYSATAFLEKGQPFEEGLKVLFDFSVDGSPVVPSAYVIPIELKSINDLTTNEETKLAFTAALVNSYRGNETLSFSLGNNFPTGASIDPKSGAFSWTPTESQGPGSYTFDIVVKAGKAEDRETLTITVNEVADIPKVEPKPTPQPEPEPESNVPDFVDPKKGAQYYLDRYNNEKSYKAWFDTNFPDYTIEEAIELAIPGSFSEPEPPKNIAPFVDPNQDPQYYIDRYNNEPSYKAWFDKSFPDQTIYEAVGVEPPKTGICGTGTTFVNGVCVTNSKGGGCLIATAAYGSEMSQQVQFLREMRDNTVLGTDSGSSFMETFNSIYYSFSPTIADWERESPIFKNAVRIAITPLLTSLSILNVVDIDSEEEMLGYGIGIILLNLGMYLVGPAFAVVKVRKYLIK
ncbi:MAG: Ig family protein [Thaumarchaeota archaeon CSP1-1]|nr:MAG: Ig family protein [Thaumarchaeota archaeon CSP1-1]